MTKVPFLYLNKKYQILKRRWVTKRQIAKLNNALALNAKKRAQVYENIERIDKELVSIQMYIRDVLKNYMMKKQDQAKRRGLEFSVDTETMETWYNEKEMILVERGKALIIEGDVLGLKLKHIQNISNLINRSLMNTYSLDSKFDLADHIEDTIAKSGDQESFQQNIPLQENFDKWMEEMEEGNAQIDGVKNNLEVIFAKIPNFRDQDVNKKFYDNVVVTRAPVPLGIPTKINILQQNKTELRIPV